MPAKKKTEEKEQGKEMSQGEKVAYHQGCLTTLIGERNELLKVVQVTEQLMQAHIEELKKLGVKFEEKK